MILEYSWHNVLAITFNSSSHLFHMQRGICGGGLVSTPGIFSLFSELKENVLKESCAPRNNTCLDLIQLLLLRSKEVNLSHICVNENM